MSQLVTLEDVVHYTAVSDIYASTDGNMVVYQTHRPLLEQNAYEDKQWLRTATGTQEIPLIAGAPFWTEPHTFWFATSIGRYQTDIYCCEEGQLTKVVDVPFSAKVVAVLNDDSLVLQAIVNIVEKRRTEGKSGAALQAVRAEIAQAEADCMTIDEFPYWWDGEGLTNKVRNILYLYNREHGLLQLTEDTFNVQSTTFEPIQNILYYTGAAYTVQQPMSSALYSLPLNTLRMSLVMSALSGEAASQADAQELITPVCAGDYRFGDLAWDDENDRIIATAGAGGESRGTDLYAVYPGSGKVQLLAAPEVSYSNSALTDVLLGGGTVLQAYGGRPYFLGTWHETVRVYTIDAEGTVSAVVDSGAAELVHDYAVTDRGIYYSALVGMDHTELYLRTWDGTSQRLTSYNDEHWCSKVLSQPERLSYKDQYGFEIVGYVLHPVGEEPGKRYPAILDIHGGPQNAYAPVFSHAQQYWVAHGYYVFWCNPTGSTGGGRAFSHIVGGTGGSDYEDIMGFTDLVLERYPQIDPARLGATGGSYGGFMTNWIIGHTQRFAAAASCRSTANNITEAANKDIAPRFMRSMTTFDDPDMIQRLWDLSPMQYINRQNTTTPTIFLHSLEDYRCYHVESLQMYAWLQYLGVPTRMILFKNESHGLSRCGRPRNRIRRLREITAWLDKYLNPDTEHVVMEDAVIDR